MANEPATGHSPDGSTLPQSTRSTTESAVTPGPTHRRTKGIFSSRVRFPFAFAGAVAVAFTAVVILIAVLLPHILSSNDPADPNLFGIAIDWQQIVQRQAASYRRRAVLDGTGREPGGRRRSTKGIRIGDAGSDTSAVNDDASATDDVHHHKEEAIEGGTSQSLLLRDVVILVTGATSGIGRELVRWTYGHGATVIAMGRSSKKLTDLLEELTLSTPTTEHERQCKVVDDGADPTHLDGTVCRPSERLFTVVADFADLESVARAADAMWEAASMTDGGNSSSSSSSSSSTSSFPIHPLMEGVTFPDHIDILVNNAGIHLGFETLWDMYPKSAQGYDLVFAVNYLSHFLLTEKLQGTFLAASRRPRVVQVTSSFHFAVDGSDLFPTTVLNNDDVAAPIASIPGGSHGFYVYKSQRQYANSKLAQILHARYLAKNNQQLQPTNHHQDDDNKNESDRHATYVSACPAWVGTSIIRFDKEGIIARLFRAMAFPVNGYGLSSILRAMFAKEEEDDSDGNNDNFVDRQDNDQRSKPNSAAVVGDYFINTGFFHAAKSFDRFLMDYTATPTVRGTGRMATTPTTTSTTITPTTTTPTRTWTYGWIPLRDCAVFLMSMFLLQWQRVWPVLDTTRSSQASYDERLQEELYDWSRKAVQQWL